MYYVGVVEDRFDPKQLGRCRVRVFGVHTDDKTATPTSDLPWSMPVTPIVSASTSGVGMSPTGIVHGAWVVGFFLDGEDKQQFMMLGTLTSTQAAHLMAQQSTTTSTPTVASVAEAAIAAGSTAVTDATPVVNTVTGTVDPTTVRQPATGWTLGQTSKKYEVGSRGAGAINDYNGKAAGDFGGAQYGIPQFPSYLPPTMPSGKSRQNPKNSPVVQFVKQCRFSSQFAGLTPATPAFDAAWKACAAQNPTDFEADQHDFVKKNNYDIMIGNLKRRGLDLTSFGCAVQDLVWSTAVQMGPGFCTIFTNSLAGMTQLDDVTIINKVMDYKIANVGTIFKSSSVAYQNSLATNRFPSEKRDLLALAAQYNSAKQIPSTPAEKDTVMPPKAPTPIPSNPLIPNAIAQVFPSNTPVPTPAFTPKSDTDNQTLLVATSTGFVDPDGVYPTADYLNQPDTNKLARGVYAGTAAEDKSLNRSTGMPLTDSNTFDQPVNPYNAKYPYNKVLQTEAGHVVEYDDTPGSERINIYHTSGTFTEIDAVGNMTRRVVGSDYQITDGNGYVRVEGRCNISVGGSANVHVSADANIEVDGDVSVSAGNDIDVYAAGRVTVSGGEALDLRGTDVYISADNDMHITAGGRINAHAEGAMNLKADTGLYAQAANNIELDAGADANLTAGGNANVHAIGDTKLFGGGSAHLKSSGMTALDGASMNIQNGSSVEAGTAASAEDAEYGEAGLDTVRVDYDEATIDDEFPTNRVDGVALAVETPEEAANGGTAAIQNQMVSEGIATTTELNTAPVAQSTPDPLYVLPTIAVPSKVSTSNAEQIAYIKTLTNIPANFKLSPNFNLGHLSINAPAQHDKVVAQCGLTEGQIAANLYEVAVNVLEPIKAKYPNMFVTSAFRDFRHNTVKSSVSQHCLGLAADMQFTGVANSDFYALAGELKGLLPAYDQLLLEYKSTGTGKPWIHISFNSKGNRGQVLTMFNNKVHGTGLIKLA